MTWTAPMTAVDSTIFTASQYNRFVRDNFFETEVAKATQAGEYFVGSGTNSVSPRQPGVAYVATGETYNATTYGDCSTPGPTVTVDTGTRALVCLTTGIEPKEANNTFGSMSFQISGATTLAASDEHAVFLDGVTFNTGALRYGSIHYLDNLTEGTNVFQCKYRTGGSGSNFSFVFRALVVIPF